MKQLTAKSKITIFKIYFIFNIFFLMFDQVFKNLALHNILSYKIFLNSSFFLTSQINSNGLFYLIIEIIIFLIFIILLFFYIKDKKIQIFFSLISLAILNNFIDRTHTINFSIIDWISINNYFFFNITDIILLLNVGLCFLYIILHFYLKRNFN